MGMFTNYENVPTSYIPCNIGNYSPDTRVAQKPLEMYNALGELTGYTWHYGDLITLEFITTGNVVYDDDFYEDAEDYLSGVHKKLQLEFFDFRYECVYSMIVPASADAKFEINNVEMPRFVRGTYKCKLTLIDDTDEEHPYKYTLVDMDDYLFTVS